MYKHIFKQIKKFDKIVIARHIGPDPDALGSQTALKDIILNAFPEKEVHAVGVTAAKYKYFGKLEREISDAFAKEALLIVLDTPDCRRVDGTSPKKYKYTIKIDHHPFVETFCNYEFIDDSSSSTCELLIRLCDNTKLEITKPAAEKLFAGIVADTGRFLFDYTSLSTFKAVVNLMERQEINIGEVYKKLYTKPLAEVRFHGHIISNLKVTKNGLAYIKIKDSVLKEFKVDAASAGNMVNDLTHIDGILVWIFLTEDVKMKKIRVSIRSRGPIINLIAENHNGGGHKFASGVKMKNFQEADILIDDYDDLCKEYNKEMEEE